MAVSFDPSLSSEVDWIRFLSKDMDMAAPRLQNETLSALYVNEGNRWLAAAIAVEQGVLSLGNNTILRKMVADLDVQFGGRSDGETVANYVKYLRERGTWEVLPTNKARTFEVL